LIANFDKKLIDLTLQEARKLIIKLEEFKYLIVTSARDRQVYTICRYVQELAAEFHSFYNSTRVITDEKDLTCARLALVYAFKTVLANALTILAVSAPERM
jgi:arginyl-tRNA synthetase